MKNLLLGLLIVLGLGAGFFAYYYWQDWSSSGEKVIFETNDVSTDDLSNEDDVVIDIPDELVVPVTDDKEELVEVVEEKPKEESSNLVNSVIVPDEFKLKVPFATQAPTESWDMPYQEACEEASLIMAYYYFANKTLNRPITNEEILKLVKWEEDTFGYYKDTTLAETARMAEEYFNLEVEISYDVTVDHLKQQLVKGNLIILPFAGRMLVNPYFSGEGPLYHMAVVKGYDSKNFITNDPGLLRLGENFKYSYKNLIDSVHDWNGGDVNNGQKVMLIVKGLKK